MNGRAQGGYWFAHAIRSSDLPPPARHVAHVLASVADNESGRVKVSLTWLEEATGLARSTVAKHLTVLEKAGFLQRNRAQVWAAAKHHERTEYVTKIPPGFPVRPSPSHGLAPSSPDGPALVRETSKASPSGGPSTTSTKAGAPSAGATGAAAEASARLGIPPHQQAQDCCELPVNHPIHQEAS